MPIKALLTAALLTLLAWAPASAHTEIESTSPRDGQMLTSAPASVSVRLSEPPMDAGARLVLQTSSGRVPLDAAIEGSTLTAPWPSDLDGGEYVLAYRAVADDGHPLEGKVAFEVKGVEPASPSTSPTVAPTPAPAQQEFPWIPVGLVAAIGVAALVGLAARRRRS